MAGIRGCEIHFPPWMNQIYIYVQRSFHWKLTEDKHSFLFNQTIRKIYMGGPGREKKQSWWNLCPSEGSQKGRKLNFSFRGRWFEPHRCSSRGVQHWGRQVPLAGWRISGTNSRAVEAWTLHSWGVYMCLFLPETGYRGQMETSRTLACFLVAILMCTPA